MTTDTVRMSSKGQVVIPQGIRQGIGAQEGTLFAVVNQGDSIVLRKIYAPSKEEILRDLKVMAKKGRTHLEKMGFTEKDLRKIS